MGDSLPLFRAEFNGSLRIEARPERLTSEAGAVVLREALERLGLTEWLVERLEDPRDPDAVTHPLAELLHTALLLVGQGWRDRSNLLGRVEGFAVDHRREHRQICPRRQVHVSDDRL